MKVAELFLSQQLKQPVTIQSVSHAGGGCINDCYTLRTNAGNYFLKINAASAFPGMFEAESKGLELLKTAAGSFVPDVITNFIYEDRQYLILSYIETGIKRPDFWDRFAEKLAALHRNNASQFGLEFNNYMGSLPQQNTFENEWSEFFILHRIETQLDPAVGSGRLAVEIVRRFNKLFSKLGALLPPEPPALIHGDLWSGNFMTGPDGYAKIIDPAVYYGHREMDLAMTKLFGGFADEFYTSYQQYFPHETGFNERVDIYNLYPLLIHVNLFGSSYAPRIEQILKRYA